jgi:hypothetical protein
MSYAGGKTVTVPASQPEAPTPAPSPSLFAAIPSANGNGKHAPSANGNGVVSHASNGNGFHAAPRPLVTESQSTRAYEGVSTPDGSTGGRPDFGRMTPIDRLAYHRARLGLGR